ncbi:MAG: hypothetical protein GX628_08940 [Clostridiales bacterium]|nr:hypothetical protein [Clostridiales bacterium]
MRIPRIYAERRERAIRAVSRSLLTLALPLVILTGMYMMIVFGGSPAIAYWRGIWIETAMTTDNHQWLATSFFPKSVIDEVLSGRTHTGEILGGAEFINLTPPEKPESKPAPETTIVRPPIPNKPSSSVAQPVTELPAADITPVTAIPQTEPEETAPFAGLDSNFGSLPGDILGQANLSVGDSDYAGNTIAVNDMEQGIVISEAAREGFKGKIMLIDDPSRVFVGSTIYNDQGTRIPELLEAHNAIAGINASGFFDPQGKGDGSGAVGIMMSEGQMTGDLVETYGSIALTLEDKLVVGSNTIWNSMAVRDGIQFGPVLIADGEKTVSGSAGYGIQPRTAIGQRADGVIVMAVIDGRSIRYSIGCMVGSLAELMEEYGCINAACCDGGSSSVMAYNGEVVNRNCSDNPTLGRRLPNAFLVRAK